MAEWGTQAIKISNQLVRVPFLLLKIAKDQVTHQQRSSKMEASKKRRPISLGKKKLWAKPI